MQESYSLVATQWNKGFLRREANLDWENDVEGTMGTSVVKLLRFIEASEYGDKLSFVSVISSICHGS